MLSIVDVLNKFAAEENDCDEIEISKNVGPEVKDRHIRNAPHVERHRWKSLAMGPASLWEAAFVLARLSFSSMGRCRVRTVGYAPRVTVTRRVRGCPLGIKYRREYIKTERNKYCAVRLER